jgi:hypothetical protein
LSAFTHFCSEKRKHLHPDPDHIELYLLNRLPSESPTLIAVEDHLLWCEPCITFAEQEQKRITLLVKALKQVGSNQKKTNTVKVLTAGSLF